MLNKIHNFHSINATDIDLLVEGSAIELARQVQKKLDPSAGGLNNEKESINFDKSKQGLGFFGYIFLFIIIGFSLVGILKTFEDDLLNYYPETEYIYTLLDEQLEYVAETVKNIIIIICLIIMELLKRQNYYTMLVSQ